MQVRPGEFELTVEARGPSPLAEVHLGERAAPWPPQEVWSFHGEDRLRVVSVEGVTLTDPAQADVPQDWRTLPAYRMQADSVLRLLERSRGLSAADANQLRLQRTAWLDFSGAGFTVVDHIGGKMRQGWRLDMQAPYALAGARTEDNEWLLVTSAPQAGLSGLEVRDTEVNLTTVARVARSGDAQPATGWGERFTQASGRLIMAPGYRLLAAIGPDSVPGAWLERWRLLDIFAVLLIGTVAWRIFGLRIALIAVATVALTHQEADSATWLWLNLLVALALLRAAPEGRLQQWAGAYRLIAIALLIVVLIPFAITQARLSVYPQLEFAADTYPQGADVNLDIAQPERAAVAPPPAPAGGISSTRSLTRVQTNEVVVTAEKRTAQPAGYEPGVQVQAGPGLPDWHYREYDYSWSGPVEEGATVRFIISPPWVTSLWRIAGVALSALLLWQLARGALRGFTGWLPRSQTQGLAVLLLALAGWSGAPRAQAAATPDPQILGDLRTRLLANPKCTPDCAAVVSAQVTAGARLSVVLSVSALDRVGVALPGADPGWAPDLVQVDGTAAGWVYRDPRGVRYVSLSPGRHAVRIEGPLGGIDGVVLAFPLAPQLIDVSAEGWDITGVTGRRLVSGALQLVRHHAASAAVPGGRQEEFPPFVSVDRLFHLAHDWTIDTTVARIAPKSSAFTVKLPLLPEEAVTTPGLEANQNTLVVGVGAGEDSTAFSSVIPISQVLELSAAAEGPYSEHWRFDVARTWHVDFAGVPPVAPEDAGVWLFEYYPRPGEHLQLRISRPAPLAGTSVAFDRLQLETHVGKRSSDVSLTLNYRSTQGGPQVLQLPPQSQVTTVQSDGVAVALRPEHDELSLSALPGAHTWTINWQSPAGVTLLTRSPALVLSAPASNLDVTLQLPQDRWVLYTFGAGVGPAILYWGELLVFIASAWFLGRSRLTPLPARDWLLLGFGLSTFSWSVLLLFAAFMAVFQWRSRQLAPADDSRFNALQVALALLAVAALLAVVAAGPRGHLGHPHKRIAGAGAYGQLRWFIDQSQRQLPRTWRAVGAAVVVQARDARLGAVAVLRAHALGQVGMAGVHLRGSVAPSRAAARCAAPRGSREDLSAQVSYSERRRSR